MAREDINSRMTLDAIVHETLLSIPESQRSIDQKRRFLNFAIKGMRYLSLCVFKNSKRVVKVEPDSNNRIDFPADMEEFLALGVPVNGKIWLLTRNNDIIPTKTVVGIDESLDSTDGEGVDLPTEQLESFTAKGGINYQGYYTLDYRNEEIIINATSRDELLLIYISSGVSLSETTYVPAKYVPAITAYILWRDVQYDRSVPAIFRKEAEQALKDEIKIIKRIEMNTLQEYYDAWVSKSMVR
jgi:hypothetical protein